MLRLLLALLMGGASSACALAAVGWTLYAASPQVLWVAQCFAAWGFAAGLACGALHLHWHGRPPQAQAALPGDELARLVRAAMAGAAAERQARPGSAADRRPPNVVAMPSPAPQPGAAEASRPVEVASP